MITDEMRNDFVNDPLAQQPDRESELGFGGIDPQIDPTLIPENALLSANLKFLFDPHFGKFYASSTQMYSTISFLNLPNRRAISGSRPTRSFLFRTDRFPTPTGTIRRRFPRCIRRLTSG